MPSSPDTTLTAGWSTGAPETVACGPVLVDESDLLSWLSAQFQTYPGCLAVTVEQVIRLEKPDTEGCNWSRTLFLNPAGVPATDYAPAYAEIVEMGRKAFNLK